MRLPTAKLALRKPAVKKKTAATSARPHFALVVGDEGAILLHLEKGAVQSRFFAAECTPEKREDFDAVLAKHPRDPLDVYLDTIDQTYTQQTLPPVSAFSTGKLIKRRLEREFPGAVLKGNVMLGRSGEARKDWNFMMVAVEPTPSVNQWLDWVAQVPNRCRGIHTLPIESEALLEALQQSEEKPHPWNFIVTHNKVSGFRQLVFDNGHMIFTRLGQSLSDDDVAVAAGVIEQEVISTLEYLKRLSLKDTSVLQVTVIAAREIIQAIDVSRLNVGGVRLLAPHDLAEKLALDQAAQPNDRFGDAVVLAYLSGLRKRRLRMWTPLLQAFEKYYRAFPMLRGIGALMLLGLVWYIGSFAYGYWNTYNEIDELKQQRGTREAAYEQLRKDATRLAEDIDKLSDAVALYETLMQEAYTPLPFLLTLSGVLKENERVESIEWRIPKFLPGNAQPAAAPGSAEPVMAPVPAAAPAAEPKFPSGEEPVGGTILVNLGVPKNPDAAKAQAADLGKRMKAALPDYEFHWMLRGIAKETERVELTVGANGGSAPAEPVRAEITFKGKILLTNKPAEATP